MRLFIYAAYIGYLIFIILAFQILKPVFFSVSISHNNQIEQALSEIQ